MPRRPLETMPFAVRYHAAVDSGDPNDHCRCGDDYTAMMVPTTKYDTFALRVKLRVPSDFGFNPRILGALTELLAGYERWGFEETASPASRIQEASRSTFVHPFGRFRSFEKSFRFTKSISSIRSVPKIRLNAGTFLTASARSKSVFEARSRSITS